jgi:hypothetical protein
MDSRGVFTVLKAMNDLIRANYCMNIVSMHYPIKYHKWFVNPQCVSNLCINRHCDYFCRL